MDILRRHRHSSLSSAVAVLLLLLLLLAAAALRTVESEEAGRVSRRQQQEERFTLGHPATPRRLGGGPGSRAPTCLGRCGGCSPCVAVLVVIPRGRALVPQAYYPEVWRCKCGDKLFLPRAN